MAVIAKREIAEPNLRRHAIAQYTTPHSTAIKSTAATRRSCTESRRIEACTGAGG
jgi:hypothetical protein